MDVKTYSKVADFLSVTRNLLQSDEARYGLIYGIARRVSVKPSDVDIRSWVPRPYDSCSYIFTQEIDIGETNSNIFVLKMLFALG